LRNRNTLIFGLILILVCTQARVGGQVPADLDVAGVQSSLAERIDREPIFIDGNADLLAQKVTYNWAGTGESDSLITIANYRVDSYETGITIRNVDLHFVIENCETRDLEMQYYSSIGIKLDNCTNGIISNSLAHMKETGILIKHSDYITLNGSSVHDCMAGVSVEDSNHITISNNDFGWNDWVGVNITGSNQCVVYANSILSIPQHGIQCIVDTSTYISNNVITSVYLEDDEYEYDHIGIFSYYSVNLAIQETTVYDCERGLEMQATEGSWVWDCCFVRTIEFGVYLHDDTLNVTIVENCIIPLEGITAYDGGEANSWDVVSEEIGNYWSDYSGSGNYYISGPAASIDHFPNLFTCDCGDSNYTEWLTTTSNTTELGEGVDPLVMMIAIGSSVIIVFVVVLIFRSNKSF